jgi:hypothetical protein
MKEIILTEARYEKVVRFLADSSAKLSQMKLSDKEKYNQAMNCLECLSSVENTQYDAEFQAVSIMLSENQMEEIIKCLIDFLPIRLQRKRGDK